MVHLLEKISPLNEARSRAFPDSDFQFEANSRDAGPHSTGALEIVLDEEKKIVGFNLACRKLTGHSFKSVKHRSVEVLFPKDGHGELIKRLVQLDVTGQAVPHECDLVCKNQDLRRISWRLSVRETGALFYVLTGLDITEEYRALKALRESESRYRTLFESANDAIFLMKEDRFFDCNTRTLTMYGCQRSQIIGKHPYNFSPVRQPDGRRSRSKAREKINLALNGRPQHFEWRHRRYDGTPFDAEVGLNRVEIDGKHYLLAIVRDISERKRSEKQIQQLNRELERKVQGRTAELMAANRELESFARSVSHDLRAPLRHIRSFSEMLAKHIGESLDEEARLFLDNICVSVDRADRLVCDLLSFSRMTRKELVSSKIDLSELVQNVRKDLEFEAGFRNVDWMIRELPIVRGDPSMIQQVFVNLMSNALKFTRVCDFARIEVGVEKKIGPNDVIFVRDNGVGFDMQRATGLFSVFNRLHSREEYEGSGIGLALVRQVLQRHGGRVWAESEPGTGATFFVSLPKR